MALAVSVIRSIWLISPLKVEYIAFIVVCMLSDTEIIGGSRFTSCGMSLSRSVTLASSPFRLSLSLSTPSNNDRIE